ncbi:MAG: hypothetical protein KJ645_05050 [Planctomycetes bacterium]|nr:hypothetical protein [Planctomycetota bacterium]
MELLAEQWLPILLSSVFVFIISSFLHMVTPLHKGDYKKLAGEEEFLEELRARAVRPGQYLFPCAGSMEEMASAEMIEKYKLGPVGFLTIRDGGVPKIGRSLIQWFIFSLLVSFFVAYVAKMGLGPKSGSVAVFRMTAAVAIPGYAFSYIPDSIWKGIKWFTTIKFIFDGVIYGLVTAGTFAWLW